MALCHSCGEEVKEDWINCPFCAAVLNNESTTQNETISNIQSKTKDPPPNAIKSAFNSYQEFVKKMSDWTLENKVKAGIILLVLIGSVAAMSALQEDEGIVVKYTVTNYNCSNVEAQYILPNEDVEIVKNLGEGESFEIEVSGFEKEDLVGVSGINRGSGYCTIIVKMYTPIYFDDVRHNTAGEGEAITLADVIV